MGMIVKGARAAGAGILLFHLQGAGARFSLMLSVHLAFHWSSTSSRVCFFTVLRIPSQAVTARCTRAYLPPCCSISAMLQHAC